MKEDEPELSNQEKRAIAAIRRELDRELGDDFEKASIHPERPKRREMRRHTGLAVGLGILAVVAQAAAVAFVASRVLAPVPYANLREIAAISSVDPQSGSGSACLIERGNEPGPVSMNFTASPTARESRPDVTSGRTGNSRVNPSKSPCPPSPRIAASPRRPDVLLASTSRGAVARGNSRPSTVMSLANPVRESRHVEAP
jgi:hypothetical protein